MSSVDKNGAAGLFSVTPMNVVRCGIGDDAVRMEMPPRGDVHLWCMHRGRAEVDDATLSLEEKERALRFRLPQDANRYRWTRCMLRRILAGYVGVEAQAMEFAADELGKPHLSHPPTRLQFNLSHSGEVLLVGVAGGQPVGVDVEWMKPCALFREIARRCFVPEIADAVTNERQFFEAWTRMEACLKGQGLGIAKGARSAVPAGWEVRSVEIGPGYVGAVALGHEEQA